MKPIKILDCTLRDGGFYNDWDFDLVKSKELVIALNEAGVDIIEIGYKSLQKDKYYGLFKYCNETLLDFLKEYDDAEYAFMLDAKEFVTADLQLDTVALDSVVLSQEKSVFQWARVACSLAHSVLAPDFMQYLQNKGYKTCFNLMGGSLITQDQLIATLQRIKTCPPDVFYIADSYGSFYPSELRGILQTIRQHYDGKIGVHLHDNQGLAYANAIISIEEEVDIIDGTLMGMGRGAGNLILEQFLLGFKVKYKVDHLRPFELLGAINNFIGPLKNEYNWGFNYTYMLSGINNTHQAYCQLLSQEKRFTTSQISQILSNIPDEKRAKFNQSSLDNAVKEIVQQAAIQLNGKGKHIPLYEGKLNHDAFLIIAGGPSAKRFKETVDLMVNDPSIGVIECNDTQLVEPNLERALVILNKFKLRHYLDQHDGQTHPLLVTGESYFPEETNSNDLFRIPFVLNTFNITDNTVHIPDYDAGMFAIAFAVLAGAKQIYLVGFDGYADPSQNERMENFFTQFDAYAQQKNISICAITPSNYKHLKQQSIYTLI